MMNSAHSLYGQKLTGHMTRKSSGTKSLLESDKVLQSYIPLSRMWLCLESGVVSDRPVVCQVEG